MKKAGIDDAVGLVDGLYPGAAAAGLRNSPRARRSTRPGSPRSTPGHADARAARPRGADRRGQPRRPGAPQPRRGSLAARLLYPEIRQTRPASPAALAGHRHRRPRPVRAARRSGAAQAAPVAAGARRARHASSTPEGRPVQTPAAFEYERATSVEGVIARCRGSARGRVIAGGHSLLPMMKLRLANPEYLGRHQRPQAGSPTSARRATRSGSARSRGTSTSSSRTCSPSTIRSSATPRR